MTKIFAHRGYSALYPENTMLAFQKALEVGADGIELDVQLTKDNIVVICHDEDIKRTSNGAGFIKDYTSEELKEFNFAFKFQEEKESIPTLETYLNWVKDTPLITNIELKTNVFNYSGLVKKVLALVNERNLNDKIIYSSFNHRTIEELKSYESQTLCGFLTDCTLLEPEKYCQQHGVECYHPNYLSLNEETIKACHAANILVHPYTINKKQDILEFISWKTDIIITNEVELALALRTK